MKSDCCDICYNFSYSDIDKIRSSVKEYMAQLTNKKVNSLYYGYGCDTDLDTQVNKSVILLDSLNRISRSMYFGQSCLCNEDIQSIYEKALDYSNTYCSHTSNIEVTISEEGLEDWTLRNPTCVAYETYEKFAVEYCGNIGIKVTASQEACDIALAIKRDIINCDILLSATAYKEACDLNLSVSRTDEECKIDWKILIERGINIEYNKYKNLVGCNTSFDIIYTIYKNNCELNVVDDNTVEIQTPFGKHPFASIAVDKERVLKVLNNNNNNNLLQDYT